VSPRPRHRDHEVEPVEQRTRQFVAEGGESLRGTRTLGAGISATTAGAEIHRPNELKLRRKDSLTPDSGDADGAVLERLPERLERRSLKLGELVEEKDTSVRETRLAWSRPGSSADDRRRRRAVMRGAKRGR